MSQSPPASWYCLELGDGLLAVTPLQAIAQAFWQMYPEPDVPVDRAVFSRHRLDGLHCEVTVYFSPGLFALAQRFGAHACQQPGPDDLELLHGSRQALHS